MSNRLRERDLQRLALRLADAMREEGKAVKHPRPSSGVSDAVGKSPIDTKRYEKGVQAAIRAFHNAYVNQDTDTAPRDPAGQAEKVDETGNQVSAGYDHDDEAEGDGEMGGMGGSRMSPGSTLTSARDQRDGDKLAADADPEYAEEWADYDGEDPEDDLDEKDKPPHHTDGMPRMSRAGRDMSKAEDDAVRHEKPNVARFAQARSDLKAAKQYFDGKPKASKVMRAGYKCSSCGESNVVTRYAVSESSAFNALRLATAKCRSCNGKNVVRAPEGHAYVTEAQATFNTRYRRESL